jgi:hypothetical protein
MLVTPPIHAVLLEPETLYTQVPTWCGYSIRPETHQNRSGEIYIDNIAKPMSTSIPRVDQWHNSDSITQWTDGDQTGSLVPTSEWRATYNYHDLVW